MNGKPDNANVTEPWPKQFASPGDAVRWADGFLLSHQRIGSGGKGGGMFSVEDLRCQAQTISVALSHVRNPPGIVYRYLWGRYDAISLVAESLVRSTWNVIDHDKAKRKSRTQVEILVALTLQDRRRRCHGSRITDAEMAKRMHYRNRQQFLRAWQGERALIRETIAQWSDESENALRLKLNELGML